MLAAAPTACARLTATPAHVRAHRRQLTRPHAAQSDRTPTGGGEAAAAAPASRLDRRAALAAVVASVAAVNSSPAAADSSAPREGVVRHTDAEWRSLLSPEAYNILRREGTERRNSSPLVNEKRAGTFVCGGCGAPLFASETKYESGTGWPSFFAALPDSIDYQRDNSIAFMPRVEVRCRRCQGHLGHVFDDGPKPSGLRYCMNGAALKFEPREA